MHSAQHRDLSRRERQILDILYERGQAISALLDENSSRLSSAELDRLARLIDTARKSGV
jgi:ABC-type sugar transport system ATPase subunit